MLTVSGDASITGETKIAGDLGLNCNPSFRLHVADNDSDIAYFQSSQATTSNVYISNTNATTNNTANLYFGPANNVAGARIKAQAMEDFSVSANRTADLEFQTRNNGTFTENVLRLKADGKVGIGTTNPSHLLHLRTDNPYIDFTDDGDNGQGGLLFRDTSNNNQGSVIFDFANNVLKFSAHSWSNDAHMALYRSTGPKLQISPDQNVAPQAMLVVSGDASITGELRVAGDARVASDVHVGTDIIHDSDPDTYVRFNTDRIRLFAGGVE